MSTADSATMVAGLTLAGVVVQTIANQLGAERARRHELDMIRLKLEHENDDDEKLRRRSED